MKGAGIELQGTVSLVFLLECRLDKLCLIRIKNPAVGRNDQFIGRARFIVDIVNIGMNIAVASAIIHIVPFGDLGPGIPAIGGFVYIQPANVKGVGIIRVDTDGEGMPADGSPVIVAAGGYGFGGPGCAGIIAAKDVQSLGLDKTVAGIDISGIEQGVGDFRIRRGAGDHDPVGDVHV